MNNDDLNIIIFEYFINSLASFVTIMILIFIGLRDIPLYIASAVVVIIPYIWTYQIRKEEKVE